MTTIDGARAVVTGASRGLGRALAEALAARGARVALVARSRAPLEELAARLPGAVAVPCDLADRVALRALPARLIEALGGVDLLVHNAGVEPFVGLGEASEEALDLALEVNLRVPVQLTRTLLPELRAARGHVVFVGSTSGLFASPFAATYGATKAAVGLFGRSLSAELDEVRCTVVQPGFVVGSGMFEDARAGRGLEPPWVLGSTTVDAVVEGTLEAIRRERAEVTINSMPFAPAIALSRLTPDLGVSVVRRLVTPFMRRLAGGGAGQGSKR